MVLTRAQHLWTFNIVIPLFITFCRMFGSRRTQSTRPSLFMFRVDRPIAWISSFRVVPGLSQLFFHFGEDISLQHGSKEFTVLFSMWDRLVRRLSWMASLPSERFKPGLAIGRKLLSEQPSRDRAEHGALRNAVRLKSVLVRVNI